MAKVFSISVDDWLYEEIESRRGEMNRSEYCSEHLVKGMNLLPPLEDEEARE